MSKGSNERIINITGSPKQIQTAQFLLQQLIRELAGLPPIQAHRGPSSPLSYFLKKDKREQELASKKSEIKHLCHSNALVDPRNLPSEIDSILEHKEADTLDLAVETPLQGDKKARSFKTAIDAGEELKKNAQSENGSFLECLGF